jgi:streptogramin lyase
MGGGRAVATVLLLGALAAGCGSDGGGSDSDGADGPGGDASPPSGSATAGPTTSPEQSTGNAAGLLGPVGLVAAADGTVWAAWSASDAVAPLEGADAQPGTPVDVGDTPLRMALLDNILWVTTIRGGELVAVDPATSSVVRRVTLGEEPEGIAAFDRHLFVVLQAGQALVEVDPSDGALLRRYDVGGAPRIVAAGEDALFVGDNAGGRVVRVEPGRKERVTGSDAVCGGVQDIQVVNGTVWAACMTDGTVVGLDPASLEVTSTVEVAGGPDGLAPGPGAGLLVSLQDGPGLAVVDTSGGTSEQAWTGASGRLLDKANTDVVERGGTAFVSDYLGDAVRVVRLEE